MTEHRALRINAGFCSETGRRTENQDYVGMCCEGNHGLLGHVAAIADGVSFGTGGRAAAELAVRCFLDAHYSSAPTMGIARNAARNIAAINSWLHTVGAADPKLKNASTTFTALILAGRDAHVLHLGDTRAYLLHDELLTCLTTDHTIQQPERDHILLRAIGMEPTVRLDHATHTMRAHDRLMLCTDGVYTALKPAQLRALLLRRRSPDEDATGIVDAAVEAGSQDNASCIIVDVLEVPEAGAQELLSHIATLPMAPPPSPGETVDGFTIDSLLSNGRYSRLLRAHDNYNDSEVVMKFPQTSVTNMSTHHQAFVREAWVAARLHSPYIGETIELPPGRQSCLYSVMPYYEGETLETRILRAPQISFSEGLRIAQQLGRAIATLHRARIIHRDIKPDNVLLEKNGGLRLIDLGVVRLPMLEDFPTADIPGTPSYMAPELFDGRTGDEASDQFALGVTLYRMFCGRYPYGEIEPFSRPRFNQATPLSRYRPDLPAWLGHLLSKALQPDPAARFGDVLEFSMEIDNGLARAEPISLQRQSLYERNPLRFWQAIAAILAVALILSLGVHAHH
ncbi:MAG: protein kinase [Steroidobacteraceae bacterium]